MLQRVLTALVGIPALLALLWIRGVATDVAIVIVTAIGLYEEFAAFKKKGYRPCVWPGYACVAALWPMYEWKGIVVLFPLITCALMLAIFGIVRREKPEWTDAATSVYPIFTVFLPMALFMTLLEEARQPLGIALIVLVFAIAFGGDVFALWAGMTMGKHKLCPAVSPKKTVEGAIGGLFGSAFFGVVVTAVCRLLGMTTLSYPEVLGLAFIGGAAGQIGDLAASLVKRHCGIKDFGSIFPGHGGVMDRLDSVMFTLIIVCSYCIMFA